MKKLIFSFLSAMPMLCFAQNISVQYPDLNLGEIMFRAPTKATYVLKNNSSENVTITNVDTGCGCVAADYPVSAIAPGQQFNMTVTYDAELLGYFSRTILVTDSKSDTPLELHLSGRVVTEIENFSGDYPYTIGNLLCDQNTIEFDDVRKGDRPMQELHIMNTTGQYIEPTLLHLPPYLRAEVVPSRIAPKKGGVIRVTLNSNGLRSMGLSQSSLYLASSPSEKVSEDKEITASVILLPEQLAQDDAAILRAPHCSLSSNIIDMTRTNGKEKVKNTITMTNTGKANLEIKSMQMMSRGMEVILPKSVLKPGESVKMKITCYASQLAKARTRPRILIITNDVTSPKVVIEVRK